MDKICKYFKSISVGGKASIAFFLASIVTKGIAYITTPLYTRLLTPSEFGLVALFFTWLEVFGIVSMFCLSNGVFNNGMIDYPDKREEYSFSMLILSNVITAIFTLIILCIYPYIKSIIGLDESLIILMCILFLFQPAYNFWITKQRYEYKYKGVVIWTFLCSILSPTIAIIWMINCTEGSRLYPRIFGAEITLVCIYIGFYIYLAAKSKFRIKRRYWKTALLFNLPLIPHYLSTYLLGSSDRIMISNMIGTTATAYYSLAYSVASLATIIWMAINSSLIPYTYEKCKTKEYKSINNITLPILVVFAVCSLGVIVLAPEMIYLLATHDYFEAIYVIPPVVGGVFFQVQYYIYANIVYYYKKPKYVMLGSIIAFSLNIILNYFCLPKFGYIAAGYTTLFCYVIQAIIDYIGMKKAVGTDVYNMKFIFILSFIVIITASFSSLIYKFQLIRYCLLLLVLLISILKRKKIASVIKSLKNS